MSTITLIGSDGAGKTTVANALQAYLPVRLKYMYMGPYLDSSNYALPTGRLYYYLKRLRYRIRYGTDASGQPRVRPRGESTTHGKLGAAARLVHRLSEEWYRQLISWFFQLRGYVVLYDRHFVFEFAPVDTGEGAKPRRLSERIHWWILTHIYPQPDLVLFLDAPAEILMQRKPEDGRSKEYLEARRAAIVRVGKGLKNFIRIDASRPLDRVIEDVLQQVSQFHSCTIADCARR